MVRDITIGTGGLGFDSWTGQIGYSVTNAETFLRSCVAQALSGGDGPRHSLHASGLYGSSANILRPVGEVVKDIAVGAEDQEFDSRASIIKI